MLYHFILLCLSVRKTDPVDRVYKEGSDRTLLGPMQATAVHCSGLIAKLWYIFLFENDTTIVRCSQKFVPSAKYTLILLCVSPAAKWTAENYLSNCKTKKGRYYRDKQTH